MHYSKENHRSKGLYCLVFVILLFLTFLTVFITKFEFSTPVAITLAFMVALVKGSFVSYFFMHLAQEKKWIWGSFFLAIFFFSFLVFIIFLSHSSRLAHYYVS